MTPSDLPEQGDPADERQWTLHGGEWIGEGRDRYFRLPTIEPRPPLGATIPVVPLERAHRAEEELERLKADLTLNAKKLAGLALQVTTERAERAEEAAREFAKALDGLADLLPELGLRQSPVAIRALLARWPGFLPNDPGENG